MLFQADDPRFYELIDTEAMLEPVSVGHKVTEGIMWWPQKNCLIFLIWEWGKFISGIRKPTRQR